MSTPSPTSPPKRPRLSLQIKAIANGPTGRTSRTLAAAVDVKSPTSFNTLSNVYATAVDRSTPVQDKPPQTVLGSRPSLRLQTQDEPCTTSKERRLQTPYLGPYLDTPITAQPISPAISKQIYFPSAMTATPPMSATAPEQEGSRVFTFESQPTPISASNTRIPQSATTTTTTTTTQPRRARTLPTNAMKLPYTHPRSLRSILRNSPLPPLSTKSPESPRRQSLRLQEKAARRVAYNSPLCQTITTSKYTKSHIDLLADDATPTTPSGSSSDVEDVLDQTMAYTGNETRDGGQTPGPFEEMRRRMAGLRASTPTAGNSSSPTSAGIRKRGKKKEKKRRWVWTIGQEGEDTDEMMTGSPVVVEGSPPTAIPVSAVRKKKEVAAAAVAVVVNPVPGRASVPVIAVPLPKPRTRMQTARSLSQTPVGPAAAAAAAATVQVVQAQQRELVPAPAIVTTERVVLTPEPSVAAAAAIEPPTPSVASVASTSQDSVFETCSGGGGDVEMSDVSSMFSDAGDYTTDHHVTTAKLETANLSAYNHSNMRMQTDGDVDMDMDMDIDTPTTATVKTAVGFGSSIHNDQGSSSSSTSYDVAGFGGNNANAAGARAVEMMGIMQQ